MKSIPSPKVSAHLAPATAKPAGHPLPNTDQHSILLLNRDDETKRLFRVPADNSSAYTQAPESLPEDDPRTRLVISVTGEDLPMSAPEGDDPSHVAFGILPIKPEPTTAYGDCYLINATKLNPVNPWTVGDWNMPPTVRALSFTEPPREKVAIATKEGKVLLTTLSACDEVDLQDNPEVWRLLRNGCVVGMVSVRGEARPVPLVNLASFGAPPAQYEDPTLTGTWDFKWPRGSIIKVLVLPPPASAGLTPEQQMAAVLRLQEVARLWLPQDDPQNNPGNLQLQFLDAGQKDYDVLVNMDPLTDTLPLSDLGTYCRRRPLNDPTMYVGPPQGIKDASGAAFAAAAAYFTSSAFDHIVCHEFGHVLGLPHLHQHPTWRGQAFADLDLKREIANVMGIAVDDEFIDGHLKSPWPGTPEDFSDWLDVASTVDKDEKILPGALVPFAEGSIMMGLPVRGIIKDDGALRLAYKTAPGAKDREWLRHLYK